jgi:hypothetical protein
MSWTEFAPSDPKQGPAYRLTLAEHISCEIVHYQGDWYPALRVGGKRIEGAVSRSADAARRRALEKACELYAQLKEQLEGVDA